MAGQTSSSDFPTTPGAFDTTPNNASPFYRDAFVTRLPAAGGAPTYSTYLGGALHDLIFALALDGAGSAVVAGHTFSSNFPVTPGAFDTTFNGPSTVPGGGDAFVARLPLAGGPLSYSTFLGGAQQDAALALALDGAGGAVVAGSTSSAAFPATVGAYDTVLSGAVDVFVTHLPLGRGPLGYSTYLGGSGFFEEVGTGIALDGSAVVLSGYTGASDFPITPGAFDSTWVGPSEAFVTRLPLSGGPPTYSTFLGGGDMDIAYALAIDPIGDAVVAGYTSSSDFPSTAGAFQVALSGFNQDAFVARVPLSGGPPTYSTYLGGRYHDQALALALDAAGPVLVAGTTESPGFPTTPGALDTTYNGGTNDGFVMHLSLLPAGASSFGSSTPGCAGPLAIGVTSIPQVGNAAFAITCGRAPAGATGLLALSGSALATPVLLFGAGIWIDLASPAFFSVLVPSNLFGAAVIPVPIPPVAAYAGVQVFAQFFWGSPCGPGGLSASNALEITLQP